MKNYAVGMKSKMHFTTFVQKKESVNNFDEFEIDECEQEDKEVPPQQSIQTKQRFSRNMTVGESLTT